MKRRKRNTYKRNMMRNRTHLKLPNGFGAITKRTDKPRRKPFEVRKWFADVQAQKVSGLLSTHYRLPRLDKKIP